MDEIAGFGTGNNGDALQVAALAKDLLYENIISDIEDYAIFLLDPGGNIITWNKGAERIKGYLAEEIIGKNFRSFYLEADRENRLPDRLIEEARINGSVQHEGWRIGKFDDIFWAHVTITAVHDDNGVLTGFLKITRDLSERVAAEKVISDYEANLQEQTVEVQKLKDLYYNFISEVEDYAVIMLNESGNIINWNTGAEHICGYGSEDVQGKHFSIFYTQEDALKLLPERILTYAAQNGREQHEGWFLRKDGTLFWASSVMTTIKDANGFLRGFVNVTRDLTERMLNEKAAQQHAENLENEIEKVKERDKQLLAELDKRNQLSELRKEFARAGYESFEKISDVIKQSAQRLSESVSIQDHKDAQNILIHSDIVAQTMKNLVWLGKVQEDDIAVDLESFNLREFIVSIINDIRTLVKPGQDITYIHNGAENINSSRAILTQILTSLLTNATLYSDTGDVAIASKCTDKDCTISITDHGIGMSDEVQSNLFKYFYRGDNVQDTNGTGLSLHISKKLLNVIGGSISFKSTVGRGSTFRVVIPRNNG